MADDKKPVASGNDDKKPADLKPDKGFPTATDLAEEKGEQDKKEGLRLFVQAMFGANNFLYSY